jgi:hypothetical protein
MMVFEDFCIDYPLKVSGVVQIPQIVKRCYKVQLRSIIS